MIDGSTSAAGAFPKACLEALAGRRSMRSAMPLSTSPPSFWQKWESTGSSRCHDRVGSRLRGNDGFLGAISTSSMHPRVPLISPDRNHLAPERK
jgi:hypothetical protein